MSLAEKGCPIVGASPAVTPPGRRPAGPLGRWAQRFGGIAHLPRVAVWRGPLTRTLAFGAVLAGVALLGERERDLSRYGAVRAAAEPAGLQDRHVDTQQASADAPWQALRSVQGSEERDPPEASTGVVLPGASVPRRGAQVDQPSDVSTQTAQPQSDGNAGLGKVPPCDAGAGAKNEGQGLTGDGLVILNEANLEELMTLRGVGAKRASDILALRQKLGKFRKVSDLLRVRGIGWKSLARLKTQVVLDRPAEAPASATGPSGPSGSAEPNGVPPGRS